MERKLQYIFIGILIVLLLIGITFNIIYDIKSRNEIEKCIKQIVELAKKNDVNNIENYINTPSRIEILKDVKGALRGIPEKFYDLEIAQKALSQIEELDEINNVSFFI